MSGQYDVANLKKVIAILGKGVQVYKGVTADGKVDLMDLNQLLLFLPVLQQLPDFAAIPKEIGDLDTADAADLIAYVGAELGGIGDAKTKLIIEKSLLVIAAGVALVQAVRS